MFCYYDCLHHTTIARWIFLWISSIIFLYSFNLNYRSNYLFTSPCVFRVILSSGYHQKSIWLGYLMRKSRIVVVDIPVNYIIPLSPPYHCLTMSLISPRTLRLLYVLTYPIHWSSLPALNQPTPLLSHSSHPSVTTFHDFRSRLSAILAPIFHTPQESMSLSTRSGGLQTLGYVHRVGFPAKINPQHCEVIHHIPLRDEKGQPLNLTYTCRTPTSVTTHSPVLPQSNRP